jgi:hypothetical protein
MERGDVMLLWASVPGYEGFYEVSNYGDVRSLTRSVPYGRHKGMVYKGRDIKQFVAAKYLCVKLAKAGVTKTAYVHELVLLAFVGERPNLGQRCEIRHLDGNKMNNKLENLKYGTIKENAEDRKLHKLGLVANS